MRTLTDTGPRVIVAGLVAGALAVGASSAAGTVLTRGPYLQLLTTHSVTIIWNTDAPAACAVAIGSLGGGRATIPAGTGTVCAIAVEGLVAGEQYAYTPLADGTPLDAESVFRADDPTRPFTLLVIGDSGSGDAAQVAVRDRLLVSPADLVLHTGDMIYDSGAAVDFDPRFFLPYRDLLRRLVLWPCLGNHDVRTNLGQPWRDAFYTPANNLAGSEDYYSFDFGNAHVAVLNSNASTWPGSAQYTFLDQDLGASTAPWKFVAFHHTIYSSGTHHGSDLLIRANLVPLFDRRRVDMVFMGHEHLYERTRPLRGDVVVGAGEGTVYVTTGGGGKGLHPPGTSAFTAYSESVSHFTRVAVDGGTLQLEMVRVDGAIRDAMTLTKAVAPTIATTSTTSTTRATVTTSTTTTTVTTTATTSSTTTTTLPPATLVFAPVADTWVDASSGKTNFGTSKTMTVDASPVRVGYLRFTVTGVGTRLVRQAVLLLTVDPGSGSDSSSGGSIHRITSTAWQERTVTYKTRPAVDGPALATQGRVKRKQVASFDLTPAVSGDGTYDLALDTVSSDDVRYVTRETTSGKPQLVLTVVPPPTTTTTSSSTTTTSSSTSTSTSTTSTTSSTSTTETTTSTTETTTSTTETTTSTTETTTSTTETTTSTTETTTSTSETTTSTTETTTSTTETTTSTTETTTSTSETTTSSTETSTSTTETATSTTETTTSTLESMTSGSRNFAGRHIAWPNEQASVRHSLGPVFEQSLYT